MALRPPGPRPCLRPEAPGTMSLFPSLGVLALSLLQGSSGHCGSLCSSKPLAAGSCLGHHRGLAVLAGTQTVSQDTHTGQGRSGTLMGQDKSETPGNH